MLLTSCATNGRGIESPKVVTVDTACKWVQPIYVSKDDVITDGTARQILSHNETFVKNCGDPRKSKK
ncbi:o-spanin [Escherichia phage Shy]|nr:o-spanin [Escherichia phage Shy]